MRVCSEKKNPFYPSLFISIRKIVHQILIIEYKLSVSYLLCEDYFKHQFSSQNTSFFIRLYFKVLVLVHFV